MRILHFAVLQRVKELSRGDRETERVCVRKRRVDEQGLVGTCFLQSKNVQRNELFKAIFL